MPALPPEHQRLAFALAFCFVLALLGWQWGRAWLRRRRLADRFVRARLGEARARDLLEEHGYTVRGAQLTRSYTLFIDGKGVVVPLRADYLVERDGLCFVAEAKTGSQAPQIRTPATRRQLLEYRVAYDVDGVLLVDAENERVQVVRFPLAEPKARAGGSVLGWLVVALGLAAWAVTVWR